MKKKIAIIGSGISGLSAAHFIKEHASVVVYEASDRPGGLIQCDVVNGFLYHKVGGHVFNSKIGEVLDWFWAFFDIDSEFLQSKRNAGIALGDQNIVGYPIENNLSQLPENISNKVILELLDLFKSPPSASCNFDEFLRNKFGKTLYDIYFKPYNKKIWRRDLKDVSLSWLKGKLPMPSIQEIFSNNILHKTESEMVHSNFYYPIKGGSQFIANRLSEGLDIRLNNPIQRITRSGSQICLNDQETYDAILFTGNIKILPDILGMSFASERLGNLVGSLASHGTTTALCEIDSNPYSWIYLPSPSYRSHRIICTGNFSPSNNPPGKMSATVEFTDQVELSEIKDTLQQLPYKPQYITHSYKEITYPIQFENTKEIIHQAESMLQESAIYLSGRFAEWEYYNMDTAIHAAKRKAGLIVREILQP